MARRKRQVVRGAQALAAACGVQRSTAYRWIKDGAPSRDDGSFDVDAVAAWARERRSKSAAREQIAPDVQHNLGTGRAANIDARTAADVSYRQVRAALAALQLQEKRGELVRRQEVADLLVGRAMLFRRRFDSMRRRLPLRLVGLTEAREIDAVLSAEFDQLLREAYGTDDNTDGSSDDAVARGAPTLSAS